MEGNRVTQHPELMVECETALSSLENECAGEIPAVFCNALKLMMVANRNSESRLEVSLMQLQEEQNQLITKNVEQAQEIASLRQVEEAYARRINNGYKTSDVAWLKQRNSDLQHAWKELGKENVSL